jgi:hypothetical protein
VAQEPKFSVHSTLRIEYLDACEIGVQNRYRCVEDLVVQRLNSGGVDQLRSNAMKTLGGVKLHREYLLALSQRHAGGFQRASLLLNELFQS